MALGGSGPPPKPYVPWPPAVKRAIAIVIAVGLAGFFFWLWWRGVDDRHYADQLRAMAATPMTDTETIEVESYGPTEMTEGSIDDALDGAPAHFNAYVDGPCPRAVVTFIMDFHSESTLWRYDYGRSGARSLAEGVGFSIYEELDGFDAPAYLDLGKYRTEVTTYRDNVLIDATCHTDKGVPLKENEWRAFVIDLAHAAVAHVERVFPE